MRDQVAVVTGAANGIGRALAHELTSRGARVALLDIDQAGLDAVADELGDKVLAVRCDITDPAQCQSAVTAVVDALGGIDVVVNNAGISHHSLVADTDLAVAHKVMAVNFFGAVHVTQAALPHVTARRGVIVAMSSVAGFAPLVGRAVYSASKHALHGWFDTLRSEVAVHGVAVLLVCPAFVATDIDKRALSGDGAPHCDNKAPIGKAASPSDIAHAIVDGITSRRRQLVLTPVGRASYWLSRLAPGTYDRLMLKRQGAAFGLS